MVQKKLFSNLFSFVCVAMCFFKELLSAKAAPHVVHWKVFLPACALRCLERLSLCLKLTPHTVQWNGFSPVWILRWIFRLPYWLNSASQALHLYGFSPVWVLKWIVSALVEEKTTPQTVQSGCFLFLMLVGVFIIRCSRVKLQFSVIFLFPNLQLTWLNDQSLRNIDPYSLLFTAIWMSPWLIIQCALESYSPQDTPSILMYYKTGVDII